MRSACPSMNFAIFALTGLRMFTSLCTHCLPRSIVQNAHNSFPHPKLYVQRITAPHKPSQSLRMLHNTNHVHVHTHTQKYSNSTAFTRAQCHSCSCLEQSQKPLAPGHRLLLHYRDYVLPPHASSSMRVSSSRTGTYTRHHRQKDMRVV